MKNENALNHNNFLCYDKTSDLISKDSLELNSFNDIIDIGEYFLKERRIDKCDYKANLSNILENKNKDVENGSYRPKKIRDKGALREGFYKYCKKMVQT